MEKKHISNLSDHLIFFLIICLGEAVRQTGTANICQRQKCTKECACVWLLSALRLARIAQRKCCLAARVLTFGLKRHKSFASGRQRECLLFRVSVFCADDVTVPYLAPPVAAACSATSKKQRGLQGFPPGFPTICWGLRWLVRRLPPWKMNMQLHCVVLQHMQVLLFKGPILYTSHSMVSCISGLSVNSPEWRKSYLLLLFCLVSQKVWNCSATHHCCDVTRGSWNHTEKKKKKNHVPFQTCGALGLAGGKPTAILTGGCRKRFKYAFYASIFIMGPLKAGKKPGHYFYKQTWIDFEKTSTRRSLGTTLLREVLCSTVSASLMTQVEHFSWFMVHVPLQPWMQNQDQKYRDGSLAYHWSENGRDMEPLNKMQIPRCRTVLSANFQSNCFNYFQYCFSLTKLMSWCNWIDFMDSVEISRGQQLKLFTVLIYNSQG